MADERLNRREALQRATTLLAGAVITPGMTMGPRPGSSPGQALRGDDGVARGDDSGVAVTPAEAVPHVDLAPITPGLQLYTVRSEMEKSVERTLARVAEIGYREVEFAGYFNRKPADLARTLRENGLVAPACHADRGALGRGWSQVLDDAATLGHRWVVVAWIPQADRVTVDSYKRIAGEFNRAGDAAKARGMRFAYHNHDFEFAPLGGTTGHAVLMAECDPALVDFELDLYWISKGGGNPIEYVTRHQARFPLVHVKDMTRDASMAEVGQGTIDFQRIFTAAKGGIRHYFVEHDQPKSPFDSITTSLGALKRYTA